MEEEFKEPEQVNEVKQTKNLPVWSVYGAIQNVRTKAWTFDGGYEYNPTITLFQQNTYYDRACELMGVLASVFDKYGWVFWCSGSSEGTFAAGINLDKIVKRGHHVDDTAASIIGSYLGNPLVEGKK